MKFYATLGNHDNTNEKLYKPFNMNGERFYTFKPGNSSARFFALDSNYMDDKQLKWLDEHERVALVEALRLEVGCGDVA